MATSGSALVCRLRRAFSSDDSENPRLWPVDPDLSELPDFTLNPRLLLGEAGDWGVSILLGVPPYFLASEIQGRPETVVIRLPLEWSERGGGGNCQEARSQSSAFAI